MPRFAWLNLINDSNVFDTSVLARYTDARLHGSCDPNSFTAPHVTNSVFASNVFRSGTAH